MKKLLIYSLLVISTACSSPEKKAKSLIENELFLTLNDFKSYEPVAFSNIDSLFSTYYMDSLFIKNEKLKIRLEEYAEQCQERFKAQKDDYIYSSSGGEWVYDVSITIANIYFQNDCYKRIHDSIIDNFKPKFIGYKMTHKFRSKNALGGFSISEKEYNFDKMQTKLITPITIDNDTTTITSKDIEFILTKAKANPLYSSSFPK